MFTLFVITNMLHGEGFIAGTLVKTAHDYTPIENIQLDDKVICYDFNGHCVERAVTNTIKSHHDSFFEVSISGENVYVAPDHKFFLPHKREWIEAKDLIPGHVLLCHCTEFAVVDSVREINEPSEFYDLTVDEYHNFCVSKKDIHVHNVMPLVQFGIQWFFGDPLPAIFGLVGLGGVGVGMAILKTSDDYKNHPENKYMSQRIDDELDRMREEHYKETMPQKPENKDGTFFFTTYSESDRGTTFHETRKADDFPPGWTKEWKKVKGGEGFIDPDGNKWTKDKKHIVIYLKTVIGMLARMEKKLKRLMNMAIKSGQMDQKTRTKNKQLPGSRERGYYKKYGSSPLWDIIENELVELVENQDIQITTHPDFVIGSLVATIIESKKIKTDEK